MREIKFRAWDNIKNIMIYHVYYNGYVWCYRESCGGNAEIKIGSTDYEDRIMQYTGLKDISGKEIYEGDICSDEDGINAPIEFSFGAFCFGALLLMCWSEKIKIIGNIYENSVLLEDEWKP